MFFEEASKHKQNSHSHIQLFEAHTHTAAVASPIQISTYVR